MLENKDIRTTIDSRKLYKNRDRLLSLSWKTTISFEKQQRIKKNYRFEKGRFFN